MKIGVVLDQQIQSGGGFQQSLNAIRQLQRICPPGISIELFTSVASNVDHPQLAGRQVHIVRRGGVDRLKVTILANLALLPHFFINRLGLMSDLEKSMLKNGVDIAYFLSPSNLALSFRRLPYILTVWDLCHRDHPEFPEVSENGEFERRERLYRNAISGAYLTLSDSDVLSRKISRFYGVDADRLIAMPFQPAGFIENISSRDSKSLLEERGLPSDYLFYPAQFWPHKNHVRILQALASLKDDGLFCSAVFCGGDKNNRAHVENMASKLGVREQVHFLGFVSEVEMRNLYEHARALVMPTYFGPTNLPPMEAWALGKPVICSDACKEQMGNAALCVNPDSVLSMVNAIRQVYMDEAVVSELVSMGKKRLKEIEAMRDDSERALIDKLNIFKERRLCWGAE